MSAAHTPGPWRLADNDKTLVVTDALDGDGNCAVVADVLNQLGPASSDDFANARLIAAAPELLEALLHAPIPGRGEEMMAFRDRQDKWLRDYKAPAIAKARGQA